MIDIDAEIKAALRARDEAALTAWRALKAKAGMKLTEAGRASGQALSEEEQLQLVRREIKERQESNEYLPPENPQHRLNQDIIAVLEPHLPRTPSAEETETLIERVFGEVQPAGPKDMGRVMAALRAAEPGLDMALASGKVKERLQKLQEG